MNRRGLITIFMAVLITGCSNPFSNNSSADWVYNFVVWNGYIYEVTDEYTEDVSKEIGKVTKHTDVEGTYSGNFSNVY